MADSIDIAQAHDLYFTNSCIDKVSNRVTINKPKKFDEDGNIICRICEDIIPERRLKVLPDTCYCVDCSEDISNGDLIDEED